MLIRALAVCAVLLATGCASILSKPVWRVRFTSDEPGLPFEVFNEEGQVVVQATTPHYAHLRSSAGYFDAMNYRVVFAGRERYLDAEMNELTAVNLLIPFVGYFGILLVDPITGCTWKLPEVCRLVVPKAAPPAPIE